MKGLACPERALQLNSTASQIAHQRSGNCGVILVIFSCTACFRHRLGIVASSEQSIVLHIYGRTLSSLVAEFSCKSLYLGALQLIVSYRMIEDPTQSFVMDWCYFILFHGV
jgi:hypothetical protein